MKNEDNLTVRLEEVKVNHWHRGRESLVQLNDDGSEPRNIPMTTLGRSAASPKQGVEADIVVVHTFDDLKNMGDGKIRGKIVVYHEAWTGYGSTVGYRIRGAQEAAKYGAVGAIIASVTPEASADNLHTGFSITASIPAAAITRRDAHRLEEEYKRAINHPNQYKVPRLRLFTESHLDPKPQTAYNIVAEVRGRELPDKIVVLGGHIDS
jgi:carboxypeptidase Q